MLYFTPQIYLDYFGRKDEKRVVNIITVQLFQKKLDLPLSVLDLVMVNVGGSLGHSMRNSLDLVQHVKRGDINATG